MYDILVYNVILGRLCDEVIHMLNEKRVKHMVKLASYEMKNGADEFKISSYFRGDYISFNVLCTLLWTTIGYAAIVGLIVIAYMDVILERLTIQKGLLLIGAIGIIYVLFLVVYGIIAYFFYKKKHLNSRSRIKRFSQGLEELEKMYEREEKARK